MRLLAVVVALIAAGYGALPGQFATNDQLRGPWRTEPLAVDSATVAEAEQACRGANLGGGEMAMADRLVILDARGGSRLTLIFRGPGEDMSECQLEMQPGGQLALGTGSASMGVGPAAPLAPNEVIVDGTSSSGGEGEAYTSVTGRVGAVVTRIRVSLSGGGSVEASVGGGLFTAWWPSDDMAFVVQAFDASGRKVGEAGGGAP